MERTVIIHTCVMNY